MNGQGELASTAGCGANCLSNSQTMTAQAVDSGPDDLAISICYPSVKICFLQENRFIQECWALRSPWGWNVLAEQEVSGGWAAFLRQHTKIRRSPPARQWMGGRAAWLTDVY